jgi:hypothetical protein
LSTACHPERSVPAVAGEGSRWGILRCAQNDNDGSNGEVMADTGADAVEISGGRRAVPRLVTWAVVTLGALSLLIGAGWVGGHAFVRSRVVALAGYIKEGRSATPSNPANVFEELKPLDYLPDFLVYPVLIETVKAGPWNRAEAALMLIQLRAYGGVRMLEVMTGEDKPPVPGARRWVAKLPRQLLEDLYAVAHKPPEEEGPNFSIVAGSDLVKVLEPDNPRRRGVATAEEYRAARSRMAELAKDKRGDAR